MSVYCHAREQVLWLVNVGKYHDVVMGVDRPEKKKKPKKEKENSNFLVLFLR
jgi:hypothetical protein